MQICDNQHPPIVHEERDCPLCAVLSNLESTESLCESFKTQIYPHLPELFL